MKKSNYSRSAYGQMRDRIEEHKRKERENEIRKRFPYKYFLNMDNDN